MPNSRYDRGRAYEYKVMRKLREKGFYPIRSAGSHGYFDIIGIKPGTPTIYPGGLKGRGIGTIKVIQCKTGKSKKHAIDKVVMSKLAEQYDGLYTVKVEVV